MYGTAEKILRVPDQPRRAAPGSRPGPGARSSTPHEFVRSAGTLYSLSKEGKGSAGALVAGLTVAVTEAAEERAKRSPGGRLPVPLVAVLDEAANVCRWPELPNLYSHYGSRGICLMTMLQSWSQGVQVWGRDGMRKLWSAADDQGLRRRRLRGRVPGGPLQAHRRLRACRTTSVSHGGRQGRSMSRSVRRERILDVADLGSLPQGRMVVFASGSKPALARSMPWMSGPDAGRIRASIAAHDPANPRGEW